MSAITVYAWMKEETPLAANFCELVNDALQMNPNMSLAQFASVLDGANKENALARVRAAEQQQFEPKEV